MQNKLKIKITQASLNQTAFDWPRNMANIYEAIDKVAEEGSDVLALEELTLTGYEANDEFQKTDNDRTADALIDIAEYAESIAPNLIISLGHPWRLQLRDKVEDSLSDKFDKVKHPLYDRLNLPFNVQTIIAAGKVQGMTAKANLFNNERGYEKRYFNEWSIDDANMLGGEFGTLNIDMPEFGYKVPFGRPIVEFADGENKFRIAHAICEEKWVATDYDGNHNNADDYNKLNIIPTIAEHAGKDGLLLLIPNASPPAIDKIDKHIKLDKLAAQYADVVVDTDGLGSSGSTFAQFGHRIIVQGDKVLSRGERMSFKRIDSNTAVVELTPAKEAANIHAKVTHKLNDHVIDNVDNNSIWDNPENPNRKYEEIIRNTAFWLFDYMRKTGAKGVTEALSGGADSAFNSTITSVMVHMGVKELGAEEFCKELNIPVKETADEIMQDFLTCVYMGTDNSSYETNFAAEFLINGGIDPATKEQVKGIGGKFLNRNVQGLIDFYGKLYQEPVTPKDGIAYENIQARGREALIMLFANKENKMAIANPNLDEARNAYATFGGDLHSGTINLNAHLNKALQLEVMHYMCENGVAGVMEPIKSLSAVLRNKPSAELQPKDASGKVVQTDEDAMQRNFYQMNAISEYMLYGAKDTANGSRRLNAGEVYDRLTEDKLFDGVDDNNLYNMIRMSYVRWGISQHKIHASPIAPTLGRNVDHQTSLRTPNINGQSKDELVLLGIHIMFKWAEKDGLNWDINLKKSLRRRAWQDENFVNEFGSLVYHKSQNRDYDLHILYNRIKTEGWKNTFKSLNKVKKGMSNAIS